MPGNQHGDKLNPEQKQIAYRSYCKHISEGLSKEAWCYEDPDDPELGLVWNTMESYMKKDPAAFEPILLQKAYAKSREWFENVGKDLMIGKIEKGSPATFQTFMRNKFGWDKEDKKPSVENKRELELEQENIKLQAELLKLKDNK